MATRRLLWQLFPSYVLIAMLSVVAVTWHANRSTRHFYLSKTAEDLEARAQLVSHEVAPLIASGDGAAVAALCSALGQQSGTRITVMAPDGSVLGDSHDNPATMENHGNRPEFQEALALRVGVKERFSRTLHERLMYVAVPVVDGADVVAVVRTSLSLSRIRDDINTIYTRIAFGGLLTVLFAAGVSLLISSRITRPVEQLKRGAERLASGDLKARLSVGASNEIGSLAVTMNRMAEALEERFQTIVAQQHQEEAVLESMVESVIAVDVDGRLITANKAASKLFGVDLSGHQGDAMQDVFRHHQLLELVENTLESAEPIEETIRLFDESEERFLQVHATALRAPDGSRIGGLLVLNDITPLRRLERVRQDFVANVSHELKTPITAIKGFVETLLGGALNDPRDADRFLRFVAKHTERLNSIIEDLLALSRIESQQEDLKLERMKIFNVLRQAVDACRVTAQRRNIAVVFSGDESIECAVNPTLIEQAVVNLLDNAIKYSDDGGTVEILAEKTSKGLVAIRVKDHGVGVDKEHLPRLFERFYRTDKARSRQMGGTGLGLAIVKHIALAHGGSVDVSSRLGEGSTFSIYLPHEPQLARN